MRLLFCCEFYFPSVGGVQEVMRQLAERMVQRGHDVTVATTCLAERDFDVYNGVRIVEFGISGNLVRGIEGEVERYREFVTQFPADAILIKAAQQWTFDALWPVLDAISARKVFIPCGFSGLYEPTYTQYFLDLPDVLRKLDHLIFYAERYRDIDFARAHGMSHWSILPNGASEVEFAVADDPAFREQHMIPQDSFVFLTVGSITGVKGHREVLEAFAKLRNGDRHVTLILNGNPPPAPVVVKSVNEPATEGSAASAAYARDTGRLVGKVSRFVTRKVTRISGLIWRFWGVARREGYAGIQARLQALAADQMNTMGKLHLIPARFRRAIDPIQYWMHKASRQPRKLVLKVDLPRRELVQAFRQADLFLFASNIEYSPLVLFETAAAGTPFLSVPVGNAEEIARWTGGGMICPAPKDERGYTRVDPTVLATEMQRAMADPDALALLGATAYQRWQDNFTWEKIAARYEALLRGDDDAAAADDQASALCVAMD